MARPTKFPDAKGRSQNHPAVLCPADRVLALYNEQSGDSAQRIVKKVKTWFEKQAKSQGWADVRWFKDVSTNHGAGCVMSIALFSFGLAAEEYEEDGNGD